VKNGYETPWDVKIIKMRTNTSYIYYSGAWKGLFYTCLCSRDFICPYCSMPYPCTFVIEYVGSLPSRDMELLDPTANTYPLI
jgi:hypothetical protein